jgi:hypothetical protein
VAVEEGEWELTGRSRLGRKQEYRVVTGARRSMSGRGRCRCRWRRVIEAVDGGSTSSRRPPGLPLYLHLPFMRIHIRMNLLIFVFVLVKEI